VSARSRKRIYESTCALHGRNRRRASFGPFFFPNVSVRSASECRSTSNSREFKNIAGVVLARRARLSALKPVGGGGGGGIKGSPVSRIVIFVLLNPPTVSICGASQSVRSHVRLNHGTKILIDIVHVHRWVFIIYDYN
jgi:hypothetical protein